MHPSPGLHIPYHILISTELIKSGTFVETGLIVMPTLFLLCTLQVTPQREYGVLSNASFGLFSKVIWLFSLICIHVHTQRCMHKYTQHIYNTNTHIHTHAHPHLPHSRKTWQLFSLLLENFLKYSLTHTVHSLPLELTAFIFSPSFPFHLVGLFFKHANS